MNSINFKDLLINKNFLNESLKTDGYVIIRGIFEDQYVQNINTIINKIKNKIEAYDFQMGNTFGKYYELSKILIYPNLKFVLKQYFKNKRYGFWGHSDILVNIKSAWHKDDGGENIKSNYFGFDAIPIKNAVIIKCAVYLQDHSEDGKGLWVIPKSHKQYFPGKERPIDTKLTKNDIILFDARLTHRGQQFVLLPYINRSRTLFVLANRINSKLSKLISFLYKKLFNAVKIKGYNRNAIFFTVGKYDKISHQFGINMIKSNLKKNFPITKLKQSLKNELKKDGIFTYP